MPPKKVTVRDVVAAVEAQPLVGVNQASKILGIQVPNFKRYRERLTEIPVEGSSAVFVRSDVEALAEEIKASRAGAAG